MPRVRQGGMRNGSPGTAYPNRTDLARQPSLPARVATGQTYGKAKSQLDAQRTVPMARPSVPLASSPTAGAPGQSFPPPPGPGAPVQSPIPPGGFGDIHRPTERPFEPVTTGISSGPGAGPEALPPGPSNPTTNNNLSSLLAQVAQQTGSAAVRALAMHAQAAGT